MRAEDQKDWILSRVAPYYRLSEVEVVSITERTDVRIFHMKGRTEKFEYITFEVGFPFLN